MSIKIATGIVLYNPDLGKLEVIIDSLKTQVDTFYLVDNASDNIDTVEHACERYKDEGLCINIIRNSDNMGIACALNQIMEAASAEAYELVLTLDQDSTPPAGIIATLSRCFRFQNVGIACPRIYEKGSGRYLYNEGEDKSKETKKYQSIAKCITSGSMISLSAWKAVGGYDDYLFMDYVDFDFCIRLIKKGYRIVQANQLIMEHELGNTRIRRLLFKKVGVTNHNSIRKYYVTRNRIYCEYKYYHRFGLRNAVGIVKALILIVFFEEDKAEKIKAIFRGIADGIRDSRKFRKG